MCVDSKRIHGIAENVKYLNPCLCCCFTGTLPAPWSALGALTKLDLSYNRLSRTIPSVWASTSPAGMTGLQRLLLTNNTQLCGSLPGSWTTTKVAIATTLLTNDCPQTSGLLATKAAISNWPGLSGWTSGTDPCSPLWTGVSCSASGVITGLDLSSYSLQVLPQASQAATVWLCVHHAAYCPCSFQALHDLC